MKQAITIAIVDDHAMMRDGIRSLLKDVENIKVVGEAENGRDAIELASKVAPDVMLIDVAMDGLNGVEAARKIRTLDPRIAIIGLSMHSDKRYVIGMLDIGARGYLLKTCGADELIRAIEAVCKGQIYVASDLTHVLVERFHADDHGHPDERGTTQTTLTPREREVLQLIAEGNTSKEIAQEIGVAVKTVETHRTSVMRKLDLHSIADLTRYAIREGLTTLSD